jgi:hypothetical protein
MTVFGAREDLELSNNRKISKDYANQLTGTIGQYAFDHQMGFHYVQPVIAKPPKTISVSTDGTCLNIKDKETWSEAMCGTVSGYDEEGERLFTLYVSSAPEKGKEHFFKLLALELSAIRKKYPEAIVQGIADGAAVNRKWLEKHTQFQALDFYHLSEYVAKVSRVLYRKNDENERKQWVQMTLHRIKHTNKGVFELIDELNKRKTKYKGENLEVIEQVLVYLENQKHRTKYWTERHNKRPIGSGVVEAACKTLIKDRFCKSGMRWTLSGASKVLALRTLLLTVGRWTQFWGKYMQYGFKKGRKN